MGSAARSVARWPYWALPGWLRVQVAVVILLYCAALGRAAQTVRVSPADLRLFALLLLAGWTTIEVTRRVGEPLGNVRDVYGIWDLPAAVLLPPLYVLIVPVPRMILTQLRVRHAALHRRAYTAATVGLAYAAASLLSRAIVPALGAGAGTSLGSRAMVWALLVAGCGMLHLIVNDALILSAVKGGDPKISLRREMLSAEIRYHDGVELALGVITAFLVARSMLMILFVVPLVVSVQRSLRHKQLKSDARIDSKVGLLNDGAWRREAGSELSRAARTRSPVAVLVLDIDHFKQVNDTYGHAAGDAVLAAVARAVTALLRDYDIVGRIGGEEFAALLPDTPTNIAVQAAERIRQRLPRIAIPAPEPGAPMPDGITVSIGIAAVTLPGSDLAPLVDMADKAMYAAKRAGRDRVALIDDSQADKLTPQLISPGHQMAGGDPRGKALGPSALPV